MNDLDAFCYIHEQTSFEDDYKGDFGYEVHDKGNRFYVTFEAVLQSFGVRNRNGRIYEAANVWDRIVNDEQIQTELKNNSLMGELDHPAPTIQGQELTMQRIVSIDPRNTSHYIRKPRLDDNLLVANIQTDSSTDAGMSLAIKIVDGKITPCFSARVLGSLNNRGGKPVVNVRKVITWDNVIYPSHPEAMAKMNQPHMESVQIAEKATNSKIIPFKELAKMASNDDKSVAFLCESFGLKESDLYGVTNTGNSVVLTENENVYVQPITDRFVRNKSKQMLRDWINS